MNVKTKKTEVEEIGAKTIKMAASSHRSGYGFTDTVLGYGLSPDIARIVKKASKSVGADFLHTDCLTDILAVPYFLLVCDFSALGEEQLKLQYEDMIEVADGNFSWLLLGTPAINPPERLLAYTLRTPEHLDEQSLRVILLRRRTAVRRRIEKTRSYDRKLFRLVSTLKRLKTEGLVKTSELCKEFDVTPRTIVRDINMLQDIGEMIEYDQSAKAFRYVGDDPWLGKR